MKRIFSFVMFYYSIKLVGKIFRKLRIKEAFREMFQKSAAAGEEGYAYIRERLRTKN